MRLTVPALLLLLAVAGSALAAPAAQWQPGRPVDQAVADQDPLAVGLRRVEAGLSLSGGQAALYRMDPVPAPSFDQPRWINDRFGGQRLAYYRIGPGFRARLDRLDYLVKGPDGKAALNATPGPDGRFIEVSAANLVYELTPLPPALGQSAPPAALGAQADGRVNGQIDGRVNGQVNARVDGRIDGSR